jgi:hypothetical protein
MDKERFAPSAESVARRETSLTMAFDHDEDTSRDPTPTSTTPSVAVVYRDCITSESLSSCLASTATAEGSRGLDQHPTSNQVASTPLLSMIQRCDSYSNFYDALSDPRLSSSLSSSSAATRLLLLLQLQQQPHFQHNVTITTNSGTMTTSTSPERMVVAQQQQQPHRRRDVLLGYSLLVATSLATAVLNAAITIFGMGVGVGLILGDTMRDFPSAMRTTSTNTTATTTTTTANNNNNMSSSSSSSSSDSDEGEDTQVYPSTPTCRATVQRISSRSSSQVVLPSIQQQSQQQQQQQQRLSTMPAQ